MGVLEIGTCGGRTPLLLLVGVLVFCVAIPTSLYSVSWLISDGYFFSNNVQCLSTIPLLDGYCSAAAVASNASACIQRCCLSSQVLSTAHVQPVISECRGVLGGGFG